MTTLDWTVNLGILLLMIVTVIGKRPVSLMTYLRPLLIVGGVGFFFLQDLPTTGHDVGLELVGVLLGVIFGVLAAAASKVYREGEGVTVQSGRAYVAVWTAAIGLRVLFADLATRNAAFGQRVAEFSVAHGITGAEAWRAAFVLMALAMVLTRVALIALRAAGAKEAVLAPSPASR